MRASVDGLIKFSPRKPQITAASTASWVESSYMQGG